MAMCLTTMATHEINTLHYERNARLPSNKIQFRAVNEKLKVGGFRGVVEAVQYVIAYLALACSRLRDGGGKSFSNKKCEKRAGAGERHRPLSQVVPVLFSLCSF